LLLTDFGNAKLQGARGLTKTGTTIGTPEYMAPEQAEGKEIDPRADVYSLGCVLYEALSGRPPFTGSTPVSVLYQQVHSRAAYIRGFNPQVPRELVRVVEMALAKRPDDRYPTAESLAQALTPFAEESYTLYPGFSVPIADTPQRARRIAAAGTGQHEALSSANILSRPFPPLDGEQAPRTPPLAATPPPAPVWKGLGEEGLDAIFPDDAANPGVPARSAYNQIGATPSATPPPHPTIPLPAFRLPARPNEPLRPSAQVYGDQRDADVFPGAGGSGFEELFPGAPGGSQGAAGEDVFRRATTAEYNERPGAAFGQRDHFDDDVEPESEIRRTFM
ncbi:MAG: serine/threonine protein kinase, partial [Ktedonobacterales bacterium]